MINNELNNYKLILASASPRRKDLLKSLDIDFDILRITNFDESYPKSIPVEEVASYIAGRKADTIDLKLNNIYVTADTVVCLKGMVLNKPEDINQASNMLRLLSGKQHEVYTGVCLKSRNNKHLFSSCTKVWFSELNSEMINYYIQKFKPFDKAGAYGIQEWIGYVGIEKIDGSYFNVMGLPVQKLYKELINFIKKENSY